MRTSNQSVTRVNVRGPRSLAASLIVVGLFVAACGSAPPSVAPVTPKPTAVITPNPHLVDPASVDTVFTAIARAGMPISGNNAAAGTDPVKTINATFRDWPMLISEYKSAESLAKARHWKERDPPGQGESPVAIIGLNILVEWGPTTGVRPPALDEVQVRAMNEFLKVIDPYVGPLIVRTTTELRVPVASQPSTLKPSSPSSPSATASATPSKKPKASP